MILFTSALLTGLGAPEQVRAQGASQDKPADKAEERPDRAALSDQVDVQLRRRMGHVRFRQLPLQQSQGPGVEENLSDQWFEGYVKPAVSATFTLESSSEIYGTLSAVGQRTYGVCSGTKRRGARLECVDAAGRL